MQRQHFAQVVANLVSSLTSMSSIGNRARRPWLTLVALCVLLVSPVALSQQVQHIYDENGRLVGTIAPNGEAARWTYDPAGNITKIDRFLASQTSVIEFSPNGGAAGSTVTIWGTGFSTTPSQNTVTINGVTATVSTATANRLTVTVPAGATSGAIVVTAPSGTATAPGSFSVAASAAAPTIVSLSPSTLKPGDTLTIAGTQFSTTAGENKVRINGNFARILSATSTQIQVAVEAVHLGGKVTVATPAGTAISAGDVFVLPAWYSSATVLVTNRVTTGSTITVNLTTANRSALVLFEASRGTRLRYRAVSFSSGFSPNNVEIYSPDGERIYRALPSVGSQIISEALPKSGTYTLYVDSGPTGTLTAVIDVMSAALTVDGAATPYSWTTPGPQQGAFVFDAPKFAKLGLGIVTTSLVGNVAIRVFDPLGRLVSDSGGFAGPLTQGVSLDVPTVTIPGSYLVVIDHSNSSSGAVSLTLSNDVSGALVPGDPATTFGLDRAGKNGRFTFSGQTGEYFSAIVGLVSGLSNTPGVSVRIERPSGDVVPHSSFVFVSPNNAYVVDVGPLPIGGTYTVMVTPIGVQTGTANIRLQKSVTGTLTPGVAVPISLASGQNARFTFTPVSSANLNFGVGLAITTPTPPFTYLVVKNAAGAQVASEVGASAGISVNAQGLNAGETYSVEIDPTGLAAIGGSLLLSQDKSGSLTIDGPGTDFLSDGIGQNGRYTFQLSAPPTRNLGLGVTENAPLAGFFGYQIRRPNGSVYFNGGLSLPNTSGTSADLSGLGVGDVGTWTVLVDPTGGTVPNIKLTLSSDVEASISANAATPTTFTSSRPGQNARYTFTGTAGRRMSLVRTGTTGFQDGVNVTLLRTSTGQAVGGAQIWGNVIYFDLLPGTESYTVFVSPTNARTGSVSFRLLESQEFSISPGGPPQTFTPAFAGQVGRFSFSTSTSPVHLGRGTNVVTVSASGSTSVRTFGPAGEVGGSFASFATQTTTSGETSDMSNVTLTGQYAIELRPNEGGTPTLQVTLSPDITGAITPGGPATTFSTTRSGQNGRYTFSATAGQKVNLTVNNGGSWNQVWYVLQRPNLSQFQAQQIGSAGGTWLSGALDATGTWTLYVTPVPPTGGSVTFGATLQ